MTRNKPKNWPLIPFPQCAGKGWVAAAIAALYKEDIEETRDWCEYLLKQIAERGQ